jgi:hypothetical protein
MRPELRREITESFSIVFAIPLESSEAKVGAREQTEHLYIKSPK